MIQFDQVTFSIAGDPLFEEVSFTLQKGERCGFVGRNGSGKSTLFRLIAGEVESDEGSISVPKNYRLGLLKQHLHFTEPTLLEEAALGLLPHEKDMLYKAEKILFGLGFSEEDLSKSPADFSGGYQLRLNLAKVLISEPNCLLLDEPTNYLDILSIRWLSEFLQEWAGEFIIITHDREFMDAVSTHTMGLHRKQIRKLKGSTIDFFQQILMEEELHEKSRVKSDKKRAHLESYIERFGAKASKATQAQSKVKLLAKEPILERLNQLSELSFAFREAPFPGQKVMEATNICFSYASDPLIEHVSVEIKKGERVAIIGKNGRGKSTLLRLLGKDLTPLQGSIEYSVNTHIGYFGQTHVERLNPKHTIESEISAANSALSFTQVKGIAGLMMFSGALSEKKISVLSGGEKSRVLLGKIVAKPCNLLLLDEPTHHLDIESIEALIDALETFTGAVIIVTHTESILRRLKLNKIIMCEASKQTVFLGDYDEFLDKLGWEEDPNPKSKKTATASTTKDKAMEAQKPSANKPTKNKVLQLEKKLVELEEEIARYHQLIEKGDHSLSTTKALSSVEKQKEQLEIELYKLYE